MILVFKLGIMLGVAVGGVIFAMIFDALYCDMIEEIQQGPWFSQDSYDETIKGAMDSRQISWWFFGAVILALEALLWLKY